MENMKLGTMDNLLGRTVYVYILIMPSTVLLMSVD